MEVPGLFFCDFKGFEVISVDFSELNEGFSGGFFLEACQGIRRNFMASWGFQGFLQN